MRTVPWMTLLAPALALVSACSNEDPPVSGGTMDSGIDVEGETGAESTTGADDSGIGGDVPPPECRKMDFLFVIDSSVSMSDEQQNLADSFPGFVETIRESTGVGDYHVMIVDTDAFALGPDTQWANCSPTATCCESWCGDHPDGLCNGYPCTTPASCDDRLGAGRVLGSSEQSCGFATDDRFLLDSQSDLEEAFSCAAKVGTRGYVDEKPMEAMSLAVSEQMNGPGGCNEGFLRKDALLIVVIITDEEDDIEEPIPDCSRGYPGSAGGPDTWAQTLLDAKGGLEQNIVVLTLAGPVDDPCPPLDKCFDAGLTGAEPAPRLAEFTSKFLHANLGSVCAPSYDEFFNEAVSAVAQACHEFEPVP